MRRSPAGAPAGCALLESDAPGRAGGSASGRSIASSPAAVKTSIRLGGRNASLITCTREDHTLTTQLSPRKDTMHFLPVRPFPTRHFEYRLNDPQDRVKLSYLGLPRPLAERCQIVVEVRRAKETYRLEEVPSPISRVRGCRAWIVVWGVLCGQIGHRVRSIEHS